jgi:hypothetical protein
MSEELSLIELNNNLEVAFKNDQLKLKLNKPIPAGWLKKHPSAKKKVTNNGQTTTVAAEYLPIDKVEFLLDYIFQEWRIEVLREGIMFNSVYVTVRVHYRSPITGEWSFHDGIGAKSLQLDADSKASNMANIKAEAVMMGLPSAKSYAIKDACDHLGAIFGRNANRADSLDFKSVYDTEVKPDRKDKTEERVYVLIENAKDIASLEKFKKDCSTPKLIQLYDNKYKQLLQK